MTAERLASRIESAIRIVHDFPIEGLPFRDITPLLEHDPELFRDVIDAFAETFKADPPDCVVCIESFGYVFGAPLAYLLGARLVLARRAGKLPRDVHQEAYEMIYSSDRSLEVHEDALRAGDRALIVDDVLASGGSVLATVRLVERCGARCVGVACLVEMNILSGIASRLELVERGIPIVALASLGID